MSSNHVVRTLLSELGIDKDSYRVVGLLPLVFVAWADGRLQRAERALIERVARDKGWLAGGGAELLARWLDSPPAVEEVDKGLELLRLLSEQERGVGAAVWPSTLRSLVGLCEQVAEAAGGHWGLHASVTESERAALEKIAEAFGLGDRCWKDIADQARTDDRREPPGPPGHFLIGHARELSRDAIDFLTAATRTYGPVVRLRAPGWRIFLLTRPEHVQQVLQDNADNYVRGRDYQVIAELMGKNLVTTDGAPWRRLRRIVQPAFRKQHLDAMAGVIVGLTAEMLDSWQGRGSIDAAAEMQRITLRVIGELAFSTDLADRSTGVGQAVDTLLHHINDSFFTPVRIPTYVPTPANMRFNKARAVFDELIYGLIERRKQAGAEQARDLLGLLLAARDEDTGEGLSDEEIRNELLAFLIAGHETTAQALTFTLYLLSMHPEVRRKLEEHVDEVLGQDPPSAAVLDKLDYTTMVIEESLRLYPPAWLIAREAVAEDYIDGYRVDKGTLLLLLPWLTHRLPDIWPNPEGFDPERFRPEAVARRHKSAYFPFAQGPHKCIGMGLSMMEMHIILPMITRRYRLDLQPGYKLELDPSITVRPRHGLPVNLHPRDPA